MSKTILANVDGFTPVIDAVVLDVGLITAAIFGKVWRYCQMADGVCSASQDRIAQELGLSRMTVNNHIEKLVSSGYLKDTTPDLVGFPHIYADTGKANLSISLTGSVRPPANLISTPCKGDLHPPANLISTPCKGNLHPPANLISTKKVLKKEKETLQGVQNEKTIQDANRMVDELLKQEARAQEQKAKGKGWSGRGSFPPELIPLADKCVAKFGDPVKRDLSGWLVEISDWHQRGVLPEDFDRAVEKSKNWTTPPVSPYSLTRTIVALAQERKNQPVSQAADKYALSAFEKGMQSGNCIPLPRRSLAKAESGA